MTIRTASVNAAMLAIEAFLTNAASIDTLAFTTFTTGLHRASGALPSRRTDTRIAQTLSMKTTVKATNSFLREENSDNVLKDVCM